MNEIDQSRKAEKINGNWINEINEDWNARYEAKWMKEDLLKVI